MKRNTNIEFTFHFDRAVRMAISRQDATAIMYPHMKKFIHSRAPFHERFDALRKLTSLTANYEK
jgi:hypothetical protein